VLNVLIRHDRTVFDIRYSLMAMASVLMLFFILPYLSSGFLAKKMPQGGELASLTQSRLILFRQRLAKWSGNVR
jgi:hypothetical protein